MLPLQLKFILFNLKLTCTRRKRYEFDAQILRFEKLLLRRGPNLLSEECISIGHRDEDGTVIDSQKIQCHLSGNVLWTQGKFPVTQPLKAANQKRLLFNGDIYSFGADQKNVDENDNDGYQLFQRLNSSECDMSMASILASLSGPFAFIYLDTKSQKLYFARDFFGRSSLLFSEYNKSLFISSVSTFSNLHEIPAVGLFCLHLQSKLIQLFPYDCHERSSLQPAISGFQNFVQNHGFNFQVNESLAIKLTQLETKLPILIKNSAYYQSLELVLNSVDHKSNTQEKILICMLSILQKPVDEFIRVLKNSVNLRIKTQPTSCKNCLDFQNVHTINNCSHSKISVLFSGGLDSTVVAFLAAEQLLPGDSIDLINVAFFKDPKSQDNNTIPDRKTGIQSYAMLLKYFQRKDIHINLVLVNIMKDEVENQRQESIRDLILPLSSVLDDSLGCCLWFAARGKGILYSTGEEYISPARVVLLGSGADELLGGYGRHRSAFERNGWESLKEEMQLDLDRISLRNMGRDNRIVSDHGVAPRMPFLDEQFVSFVTQQCELWMKCCPMLGDRGLGEKLILRICALKLFGEENVEMALFPKRAMQFGSKIAKLESRKEKGGDECVRLLL